MVNFSVFNIAFRFSSNITRAFEIPWTMAPACPVGPPPLTLHLTSYPVDWLIISNGLVIWRWWNSLEKYSLKSLPLTYIFPVPFFNQTLAIEVFLLPVAYLLSLKSSFNLGDFDVRCSVSGGGPTGQAGALVHGISKALVMFDENLKSTLKTEKLTTRDSRAVERKKPGRRKARRSFQFSKR